MAEVGFSKNLTVTVKRIYRPCDPGLRHQNTMSCCLLRAPPLTEYCYRNYNSGGNSGFKWSVSLPEGPLLWVGGSDRSKTTTSTHSTPTNLLQGAPMYSEARPAALTPLQRTRNLPANQETSASVLYPESNCSVLLLATSSL